MLVADVLKIKGGEVYSIVASASLGTAAALMASSKIGALVVEGPNGELVGLISEREITAAIARWTTAASTHAVGDVMMQSPATTVPEDSVLHVMALMTERRSRQIPVVVDGRTIGVLSIGDILKSRLKEKTYENQVLQDIARWSHAA